MNCKLALTLCSFTVGNCKSPFCVYKPFDETTQYVIGDNDSIFSWDFKHAVKRLGLKDTPTAFRSPWQNGYCERVIARFGGNVWTILLF